MNTILIEGKSNNSKVYINNGIFKMAAKMCMQKFDMKKVHIITDDNVESLYLDALISDFAELAYSDVQIEEAQEDFDFEISYSIIPSGEQSKNLATLADIYDSLADAALSRKDLIIALGGGVVGDIAGFAAATYLRGVNLCQIPTTLLSQVDSSVGGKCAIDLAQGKNLVGSFYQPHMVIIDPQLLETLSEEVFADGMAEVIKYGFIDSPEILEMAVNYAQSIKLGERNREKIQEIIHKCIDIKKSFVEEDEYDTGKRQILNFGHTLGHAIEKLSGYGGFTHGQAISIGMVCALKMFSCDNQDLILKKLTDILNIYALPTELPYQVEEIFEAVKNDKKRDAQTIRFVVLKALGRAEVIEISMKEFMSRLRAI